MTPVSKLIITCTFVMILFAYLLKSHQQNSNAKSYTCAWTPNNLLGLGTLGTLGLGTWAGDQQS